MDQCRFYYICGQNNDCQKRIRFLIDHQEHLQADNKELNSFLEEIGGKHINQCNELTRIEQKVRAEATQKKSHDDLLSRLCSVELGKDAIPLAVKDFGELKECKNAIEKMITSIIDPTDKFKEFLSRNRSGFEERYQEELKRLKSKGISKLAGIGEIKGMARLREGEIKESEIESHCKRVSPWFHEIRSFKNMVNFHKSQEDEGFWQFWHPSKKRNRSRFHLKRSHWKESVRRWSKRRKSSTNSSKDALTTAIHRVGLKGIEILGRKFSESSQWF
jgi:hypothetical protein